MSECRTHSSIWLSLRRSHSCAYTQRCLSSIGVPAYQSHNLPKVAHDLQMTLFVFISVRYDNLCALLCQFVDEVSA